jgi:hypothetical protein
MGCSCSQHKESTDKAPNDDDNIIKINKIPTQNKHLDPDINSKNKTNETMEVIENIENQPFTNKISNRVNTHTNETNPPVISIPIRIIKPHTPKNLTEISN